MASLSTKLLSANREMKSILSRATHGLSLEKLKSDNARFSRMNKKDLNELLVYINSSNTILFFERDGEECIILRSNYEESYGPILDVYLPKETSKAKDEDYAEATKAVEEASQAILATRRASLEVEKEVEEDNTVNDIPLYMRAGFKSHPLLHINRESPVEVDLEPLMDTLEKVPEHLRLAAAEIMGYTRDLRMGLTESELTRKSTAFDYLDAFDRGELLDFLDEYSDDYALVSEGVFTRSPGTVVLLHRKFWNKQYVAPVVAAKNEEIATESPFGALASLIGKLPKGDDVVVKPVELDEPAIATVAEAVAVETPKRPILTLKRAVEIEPEEPVVTHTPASSREVATSVATAPVTAPKDDSALKHKYATLEAAAKRVALAEESLNYAEREYAEAMEALQELVLYSTKED